MRYLIILAVVLVSLCIMSPNVGQSSVIFEDLTNPDLSIKVEAIPSVVKSGKTLDFVIQLTNNKQMDVNNPDSNLIYNVNFLAYDQCVFSGDSSKDYEKIRANQTVRWNWKWTTGDVVFQRDCAIRFRTQYNDTFHLSHSITVLSDTEYNNRDRQGTLGSIPVQISFTKNSIKATISFSKDQPFIDGDAVNMYIDYENIGNGIIDSLNIGDVYFTVPSNMIDVSCTAFNLDNGRYVLNRQLRFLNNKAPRSTCTFVTKASQDIDAGSILLTANYKYLLDNSLTVSVRP